MRYEEAKAFTLCDVNGNTEGLGLVQPVATERLVHMELLPSEPHADVKIELVMVNGRVGLRVTEMPGRRGAE